MNGIGRGIRSVFFSSLNSDEGIIEVINGVISDSRIFYPQSQVHLVAAHGGVSVVLDIDVFKFSVTVILKEGSNPFPFVSKDIFVIRSKERREGKECVSTC